MKSLIVVLVFFITLPSAYATEIQLLNPDFFGQPATSPVELHYEGKPDQVETVHGYNRHKGRQILYRIGILTGNDNLC